MRFMTSGDNGREPVPSWARHLSADMRALMREMAELRREAAHDRAQAAEERVQWREEQRESWKAFNRTQKSFGLALLQIDHTGGEIRKEMKGITGEMKDIKDLLKEVIRRLPA